MKKILFLFVLTAFLSCTEDPIMYSLNVTANPPDGGSVTPESGQFEEGETVNIKATPSSEYEFFSWSGVNSATSSASVVMDSDKTITALFTKKRYPLAVSIEGEGEVSETILKPGSTTDYNSGTIVALLANPSDEWLFKEWKGDLTSSENPTQITIDSPKEITAVFEKKTYPLTIEIEGNGSVTEKVIKSGAITDYNSGTVLELTAVPETDWSFLKWSGDINLSQNPVEITVDQTKTIKAEFYQPTNFTGLPIVYVNTSGIPIDSKEDYVEGSVHISGEGVFSDLSETDMKIKGRGNSTWWQGGIWGKKPYQIKFGDKTEVLNMPKDKKWVLLAEISDPSLIRNKIVREMANISRFDYVPQAEYVELFINNEHAGTYLIGQKVEESKNRVNIGDEGYLVEIDTNAHGRVDLEEDIVFKSSSGYWNGDVSQNVEDGDTVFNIKEPGIDYGSEEYNLIKDHVDNFESALFGEDFKDPESGYRPYIDLDSFIDYYIVNEISKNQDAASFSSIYFSYVPGEKIKMGPVWDYDLAFGNVNYSTAEFPEGFWIKSGSPWYKRMFEDDYFKDAVRERFDYYYSNLTSFQTKIDEFEAYLSVSQAKNFELYPGILDPNVELWPVPERFDNHHGYVEHLKNWINARMEWLNTWL
jgi:hypothetical protein